MKSFHLTNPTFAVWLRGLFLERQCWLNLMKRRDKDDAAPP
jgi:hypothetical protein